MKEHGITTTSADYWVHFFPLDAAVYWYRTDMMKEFIRLRNIPETLGRSKNGAATGSGFLIKKNEFFIQRAEVPDDIAKASDWQSMTDREFGFLGELCVMEMIERRLVRFATCRATSLRQEREQHKSMDLAIRWLSDATAEVKSERAKSSNLYVQRREGGHVPNLVRTASGVESRMSDLPPFADDCPF
jgi:hypothetical protein